MFQIQNKLKKYLKKSLKDNEIINIDEPTEKEDDVSGEAIKSPIVGTAYLSPEPGAKPFVSVGKKIKKGETLLIVEAMKTMNHVPSTKDGVVKKFASQMVNQLNLVKLLLFLNNV